jgi:hypothetical protein
MKSATIRTSCLLGLLLAVGADQAFSQTIANGPYYSAPSWDQTIACTTQANCPRFIVLSNMASAAVLDRETGLVWERSPASPALLWSDAVNYCRGLTTGNRMGWRLPAIEEILTLPEPDTGNFNTLPQGHPFTLSSGVVWSTTLIGPTRGLGYDFHQAPFGGIGAFDTAGSLADSLGAWCVRGGKQGPITTP